MSAAAAPMRSAASISRLRPGEIVALIGTNGAGKTTTLWAISGLLRCHKGRIAFAPAAQRLDISRMPAERIVAAGVSCIARKAGRSSAICQSRRT